MECYCRNSKISIFDKKNLAIIFSYVDDQKRKLTLFGLGEKFNLEKSGFFWHFASKKI